MLLNLWSSDRDKKSKRPASSQQMPHRPSLLAALHSAGFGAYASCIKQRAVRTMLAEDLPEDAMWLDRVSQLDALVSAFQAWAPAHTGMPSQVDLTGTPNNMYSLGQPDHVNAPSA
jgi:hypothetical protein